MARSSLGAGKKQLALGFVATVALFLLASCSKATPTTHQQSPAPSASVQGLTDRPTGWVDVRIDGATKTAKTTLGGIISVHPGGTEGNDSVMSDCYVFEGKNASSCASQWGGHFRLKGAALDRLTDWSDCAIESLTTIPIEWANTEFSFAHDNPQGWSITKAEPVFNRAKLETCAGRVYQEIKAQGGDLSNLWISVGVHNPHWCDSTPDGVSLEGVKRVVWRDIKMSRYYSIVPTPGGWWWQSCSKPDSFWVFASKTESRVIDANGRLVARARKKESGIIIENDTGQIVLSTKQTDKGVEVFGKDSVLLGNIQTNKNTEGVEDGLLIKSSSPDSLIAKVTNGRNSLQVDGDHGMGIVEGTDNKTATLYLMIKSLTPAEKAAAFTLLASGS